MNMPAAGWENVPRAEPSQQTTLQRTCAPYSAVSSPPHSKWTGLMLLCVLAAVLPMAGCIPTQDTTSLIHPCSKERFQECPVNLETYRPAQDRVGGQDPSLALAVAISGGGHRAGNFAVGVLVGLEEMSRDGQAAHNALREVDYLSTASGGGLAAAAYVSSLYDYQVFRGTSEGYSFTQALAPGSAPIDRQYTDPALRGNLEYNYVSDIVQGMFSVVTLGSVHRGDFLENSFDDHILGRLWRERKLRSMGPAAGGRDSSLRLSDMFVSRGETRDVRLPYWVANATTYENAAIFPFTSEHLKLYQIRSYRHRLQNQVYNASAESYDSFVGRVPVALGLTASGDFPVLLPATTLGSSMDPKNPYLHLLDGGLSDNFGAITAVRMLRQDRVAKRKVLIVIDAYSGPLTPFSKVEQAPGMLVTGGRVTTAFLDAWRVRYREILRDLCSVGDIQVVFLSFDDLESCKMADLERFGFSSADLAQLKREGLTPGIEMTPFAISRDIWTWYDLSVTEQKLLLAVGRYLVDSKKDKIRAALGWTPATSQPTTTSRPAAMRNDETRMTNQ
jgi:hypothetical protein